MKKYFIIICIQILIVNVLVAQNKTRVYENELQYFSLYDNATYTEVSKNEKYQNDTVSGKWYYKGNNIVFKNDSSERAYKMSKDSLFLTPPLSTPINDHHRLFSQLHLTKYYDSKAKLFKEYKYKWKKGEGYLLKK